MRNGLLRSEGKFCPSKSAVVLRRWNCFAVILGAMVWGMVGQASAQAGGQAGPAKGVAPAEFAGSESCATCHQEVAKAFADNAHVKMAETHGKSGVSCENCHGAGKAHAESADPSKIFNPAKGAAKEV